ncbi:8-amino-7-oxononanoate synthase [Gammaproteobacteria bacterium 42_54_T18]|nr:8-amino-7-oxononanoate synthase [Gammaproteobacteria bacterium 42_54_T18]
MSAISQKLANKKKQGLYRTRRVLSSPQQPMVCVDDVDYLAFCSNDYLGLANHPRVVAAFKRAADLYGVGSGASHLVLGHSKVHHQLEEALAEKVGRDRALLFSSGYMANVGVINALVGAGDTVFEDKLNHASLLDGGLISKAKFQRYLHNDTESLHRKLIDGEGKVAESNTLVVTDSVFSMDGDVAPLTDLSAICRQQDAMLMVDDAHGFGVMGEKGAGALNANGLTQDDVPVLMATLGKALGTAGAFVAGSDELIEYLIQEARTYIYTTALPPAVAAATLESLQILVDESWRQDKLQQLIKRFRLGAQSLGLNLMASSTAIQPVLVGGPDKALAMSQKLQDQGLLVTAIRPPTVPKGTARLRVTLSANHSEENIDQLLDGFSCL